MMKSPLSIGVICWRDLSHISALVRQGIPSNTTAFGASFTNLNFLSTYDFVAVGIYDVIAIRVLLHARTVSHWDDWHFDRVVGGTELSRLAIECFKCMS